MQRDLFSRLSRLFVVKYKKEFTNYRNDFIYNLIINLLKQGRFYKSYSHLIFGVSFFGKSKI